MSKKKSKVGPELEALALKIAAEALADQVVGVNEEGKTIKREITFAERLDAFGKLTAYHIGLLKVKVKMPDDDDDEPGVGTVANFADKLKSIDGGKK